MVRAVKRTDKYVVGGQAACSAKYEMELECVPCVLVVSSWRRVWRPKLMLGSRSTVKNFWSTDRNFWNMCSSSGIITTLKRRRRNWRGCVINLVRRLHSASNSPHLKCCQYDYIRFLVWFLNSNWRKLSRQRRTCCTGQQRGHHPKGTWQGPPLLLK